MHNLLGVNYVPSDSKNINSEKGEGASVYRLIITQQVKFCNLIVAFNRSHALIATTTNLVVLVLLSIKARTAKPTLKHIMTSGGF